MKQINFKFAKNWKQFSNFLKKSDVMTWDVQSRKIQTLFEASVPNLINWTQLWSDYHLWTQTVMKNRQRILWKEEQRQIETLLLNQITELNSQNFVLAYMSNGEPEIDGLNKMTYWEAMKMKKELGGDANGIGGAEHIDRVTIVNLKALIK